jgi:hypothetical protein
LAAQNGISTQNIYPAYVHAALRRFDQAEKILGGGKASGITTSDAQAWYPRITLALDQGNWSDAQAATSHAQQDTAALKGNLHDEFMLIELSLRTLTESSEIQKPALAGYLKALAAAKNHESPDAQFSLLFAAYLTAHAGNTALAESALTGLAPISRSGDYPYLSSMLAVVEAELARARGQSQQAIALLKPQIDGSEYYFSHRVLMDAYATQGDYANALAEAQWLARHRGRAYAEQFGQGILEPFNVALSDLALLDAAEYSAKLKKPDAAREALGDLRKAWPRADQLPFLQQRLRVLENTLAAKPDPV